MSSGSIALFRTVCDFNPDCAGDVDVSGAVNPVDVAIILYTWGTDGGKYPGADVDGNGTVESADLSVVLSQWGDCPD